MSGEPRITIVRRVMAAVLGELRSLVPEEVAGVTAVLPVELRSIWEPLPAHT